MKKIELQELVFENFKGIRNLSIKFEKTTCIYGQNKAGKTTVFDGWLYLMFGKDSSNRADFDIKTIVNGEALHKLNHSVTGTLLDDGNPLELKKTHYEKWTKKKGQANRAFEGHKTDHFIDGVPVPKTKYDLKISELIDEKLFRLLTDATFFNTQLPWTDRRNILTEMSGELKENEIEGYSLIKAFLGERTAEDHKKVIAAERKKINDELESIPIRIDELTKQFIEIPTAKEEIQSKINELTSRKENLQERINEMKNDAGEADRKRKFTAVQDEITQKKSDFSRVKSGRLDEVTRKLSPLRLKRDEIDSAVKKLKNEAVQNTATLERLETEIGKTRTKWSEIANSNEKALDTCPTCKQSLPATLVEETNKSINMKKAEQEKELNKKGQDLVKEREDFKERSTAIDASINARVIEFEDANSAIDELQAAFDKISQETVDISDLEKQQRELQTITSPIDTSDLEVEKQSIVTDIKAFEGALLNIEKNKGYQKRIDELSASEKKLSQKFADLEKQLNQIEEFIVAKTVMVEDKVNKMFEIANFRMFEKQINEGTRPVCMTLIDGVPYSSANNGGRVQVGIDIIKTLQKHYGIYAPIWVDNRESVSEIPEADCQVINLYVSPSDESLRVEYN